MRGRPAQLFFIVALAACAEPTRTEIVVAVDTDLAVPEELDAVRIDMVGPLGQLRRSMGFVADESALPATVGMVHREGPLGPVQVTVTGSVGGRDIIQRLALVDFVANETLVLYVLLGRDCLDVSCPVGETCDALRSGCRAVQVGREELSEWNGSVGRTDGGAPDGCMPASEMCNGMDDDCDGNADEDFDLSTDMTNCGSCGTTCPTSVPNASSSCTGGACTLNCDPTWADCNVNDMDGCEASLASAGTCGGCTVECAAEMPFCQAAGKTFECVTMCVGGLVACGDTCVDTQSDPLHCGDCGTTCTPAPGSSPVCTAGACGIACDPDYGDCNMSMDDGCETSLTTVSNCATCGTACSLPNAIEACVDGACAIAGCEPPFGHCDTDVGNGCEADLSSSATDCGACGGDCSGMPPNASLSCIVGMCQTICAPGFGDCDMDAMNGCEESTTSAERCGACGIRCVDPTPVCTSDMGSYMCISSCAGTMCPSGCTDTSSDPLNCSMCDQACPSAPQAVAICMGGACGIRCNTGFGDCNSMSSDGCESSLATVADCGACGAACAPEHASGSCAGGDCAVASCNAGWLDCDTMAANGCESSRNAVTSCGSCSVMCPAGGPNVASVACTSGTCRLTCSTGFGNCDADLDNGCETPLDTTMNCGACGSRCEPPHGTGSCDTGSCAVASCNTGWGNCDMSVGNGCETDTTRRRRHCGMCGNDCGEGNRCCDSVCMDSCP